MTGAGRNDTGFTPSHPDKVLFPQSGLTKADLIDYYRRVYQHSARFFEDRPLTMERYPDGIEAGGFYQKNMPDHFPDWIGRADLPKEDGRVTYVIAGDAVQLAFLANQGCITPHLALSRCDRPDHPDQAIIDLDPSDGDFAKVQEVAALVRSALEERGLPSFVKSTGSRGLHIVLPLDRSAGFDAVRDWIRALARDVARAGPDLATTEHRKDKRGSRVFLDTGRNAYGQTAVAPFGVRARPGAPVATPLRWDEALAGDMTPDKYTIKTVFRRLAQISDPWAGFFDTAIRSRDLAPG